MKDFETIISGIDYKIRKLINLQKKLKTENQELLTERNELLKKVEILNEKIKETENKYKVLRISKKIEGENGERDIKLKINEMVREIDKCVALLNK